MPRKDPVDDLLRRLDDQLRDSLHEISTTSTELLTQVLCACLKSRSARAVVRAARAAGERGLRSLQPELEAAFHRMMRNGAASDPGCLGKLAVVEALRSLEAESDDLFLAGLRHVQREKVWGGTVDTAPSLRGACAMALAQAGYPDIYYELVTLLADPEPPARRAAVQTLTYLGGERSELLLRMKALSGDPEPDVIGLCLTGLMNRAPDRSLEFVAKFLDDGDPAVAEGAALALGESRAPRAFEILTEAWERNPEDEFRRGLLLPLALLRTPESFDFLVAAVEERSLALAEEAVTTLGIYRDDPERRDRVRDAVDRRRDRSLARAFRDAFFREGGETA